MRIDAVFACLWHQFVDESLFLLLPEQVKPGAVGIAPVTAYVVDIERIIVFINPEHIPVTRLFLGKNR
jgi:hypothetical protein